MTARAQTERPDGARRPARRSPTIHPRGEDVLDEVARRMMIAFIIGLLIFFVI